MSDTNEQERENNRIAEASEAFSAAPVPMENRYMLKPDGTSVRVTDGLGRELSNPTKETK